MEDLLIKYVLGEATREEAAQVERWLEADAANRRRHEEYKTLWAVSRETAARESAASADSRGGIVREKRARLVRPRWLQVAAVVAGTLILGAGGYWLFMNHRQVAKTSSVARSVPRAAGRSAVEVPQMMKLAASGPRTDTLPDGTVVTLNRGAALTIVGGSVEKGLTVRLRGEGFFSVRHDPARTFAVQIGAVVVRVLGTSFELNGDRNDSIELIVETGAVRVGDRMTVHSGERMTMTARGHWRIGPNRDKLYGYYLGRPLVCDSLPLRRLVEVLNRANETPIVLGRKELGDLPLTTVFPRESPERILEVVALTFNLSIVRQGSAILLQ
jgi:transmembrane sensor